MNTTILNIRMLSFMALFLGIGLTLNAQQKGVPANIQSKFAQDYPNAQNVNWDIEDGEIEAEFEENGLEFEVVYDAQGNVLYTESGLERSQLPAAIEDYLGLHCAGLDFEEAVLVNRNGSTEYEVEMQKPGGEIELLFDADGNLLHRAEEEYEDDDQ